MNEPIIIESASLVDKLYSNHLTVWYTLFALYGLQQVANRNEIEITQKDYRVEFSKILEHLPFPEIENTVKNLAVTSACRAYLRENFRITQNYCTNNNILNILQEQKWYQFARILVNCISHDMVFDLSTVNKNRLPAVFKGVEIQEEMHGQHLNSRFTAQVFLDLGDTILLFVANNAQLFNKE